MKNTNPPDSLNWEIKESWGISLQQDSMLVDRLIVAILGDHVDTLSPEENKARIKTMLGIKATLIADWESGQRSKVE